MGLDEKQGKALPPRLLRNERPLSHGGYYCVDIDDSPPVEAIRPFVYLSLAEHESVAADLQDRVSELEAVEKVYEMNRRHIEKPEAQLERAEEALRFYENLQWKPRVIQWWPFTRSDVLSKRAGTYFAEKAKAEGVQRE